MGDRPQQFRISHGHPLAQGLAFAGLGGYPGSTRFHDDSLYGNHGTLTNMDPATDWVWVPELGRWATDFDGSNDYITLGNLPCLNGLAMISLAGWAKRTVGTSTFGKIVANDLTDPFALEVSPADVPIFRVNGALTAAASTVSEGVWHHIAGVYDGTTLLVYVNGKASGTPTALTGAVNSTNQATLIGNSPDTARLWIGGLADIVIYGRSLTPPEISLLADPSNVMLSGLILPPRRRLWGAVVGVTPSTIELPTLQIAV